jgi:hypothetical protein
VYSLLPSYIKDTPFHYKSLQPHTIYKAFILYTLPITVIIILKSYTSHYLILPRPISRTLRSKHIADHTSRVPITTYMEFILYTLPITTITILKIYTSHYPVLYLGRSVPTPIADHPSRVPINTYKVFVLYTLPIITLIMLKRYTSHYLILPRPISRTLHSNTYCRSPI